MTTDRRCFVLYGNRVVDAALSGGTWALGLDALKAPTLLEDVARCVTGRLEDAVFTATWDKAMTIGGLALVGHTLAGGAKLRLTWSRGGAAIGAPVWEPVFPRLTHTRDLSYDDPGWWTGRPSAALRRYYQPAFVHVPAARLRADALTVEIDARGQAFDLSYLFLSPLFRPDWPMGWGRTLEPASRTVTDMTPPRSRPAPAVAADERDFPRLD